MLNRILVLLVVACSINVQAFKHYGANDAEIIKAYKDGTERLGKIVELRKKRDKLADQFLADVKDEKDDKVVVKKAAVAEAKIKPIDEAIRKLNAEGLENQKKIRRLKGLPELEGWVDILKQHSLA